MLSKQYLEQALASIASATSIQDLETLKVKFLGKNSKLTELLKSMKHLDDAKKKELGPLANNFKKSVQAAIKQSTTKLKNAQVQQSSINITLPAKQKPCGSLHPITLGMHKIVSFFTGLGFTVVDGPEIETQENNFTHLNLDEFHPARDEQDTFYFANGLLLRTHTSTMQIRALEKLEPPVRIIAPGRVYRRDSDPTHTPMFHQVEGLFIDKTASLNNLKGTLESFLENFFEQKVKTRLRPSFFPFTEPSMEVDIQCMNCTNGCNLCKGTTWLEVLGCGMVNPIVLKNMQIDASQYSGWAFGLGIDRLVMLKYKIPDLRLMFSGNLAFLQQFKGII